MLLWKMVSERDKISYSSIAERVLILVVVEDGLRGVFIELWQREQTVLILVVVEDGLRVQKWINDKK